MGVRGLTRADQWKRQYIKDNPDKTPIDVKAAWIAKVNQEEEKKKKEKDADLCQKEFERQQRVKKNIQTKYGGKAERKARHEMDKRSKQRKNDRLKQQKKKSTAYTRYRRSLTA